MEEIEKIQMLYRFLEHSFLKLLTSWLKVPRNKTGIYKIHSDTFWNVFTDTEWRKKITRAIKRALSEKIVNTVHAHD